MLTTWTGKYKAIVDAPDSICSRVHGSAYQVLTREQEEVLQFYETDKYEVVRCVITKMGTKEEVVKGLTFRFVNNARDGI